MKSSATERAAGRRVPAEARRRQLLELSARILTDEGLERLEITMLAERAGVSRPLVYRLFPTRHALVREVLADFTAVISERFQRAILRALPGTTTGASTIEGLATLFVEACCDAIEQKGAGPWLLLLDAQGADPEVARLGREALSKLLGPWEEQLAAFTGSPPRRAANHLWVIVAAGRAAIGGWIAGSLSRSEAVSDATRAVSALVEVFRAPAPPTPKPKRRGSAR
ncbi:MAG: TetR/AcrR family transcriptional regulator [Sandaracinus sp.]